MTPPGTTSSGPDCRVLDWDSRFFGFPIARCFSASLSRDDVPAVETWRSAHHIRCLYWLASDITPETLDAAAAAGFKFVDLRLELEAKVQPAVPPADTPLAIEPANEQTLPALLNLARSLHTNTRFYRDLNFPRDRARELYAEWLRVTHLSPCGRVFAAINPRGAPAGYLACQWEPNSRVAQIGLVGVDAPARGLGLGAALVRAGLNWFRQQGATVAQVVTQGDNVSALRLYHDAGFHVTKASVWFHRWS